MACQNGCLWGPAVFQSSQKVSDQLTRQKKRYSNKNGLQLKNHTHHDCHFSVSQKILQGYVLPYHFVVYYNSVIPGVPAFYEAVCILE